MNRNSHARRALGVRAGWVIAAVGAALVACAVGAALVAQAVAPVSRAVAYNADRVSALPTRRSGLDAGVRRLRVGERDAVC